MRQNISNSNTVRKLVKIQSSYLEQRKSQLREKLKYHFKYVDGLLCVQYKCVAEYLKHQLKNKILKSQVSGETFCRKTRKQFAILKDQLYVNVNWLFDMVELNLVKI